MVDIITTPFLAMTESTAMTTTTAALNALAFVAGYGGGVLTSAVRRKLAKWFTRKLTSCQSIAVDGGRTEP